MVAANAPAGSSANAVRAVAVGLVNFMSQPPPVRMVDD
jgi:hypothetical protein